LNYLFYNAFNQSINQSKLFVMRAMSCTSSNLTVASGRMLMVIEKVGLEVSFESI